MNADMKNDGRPFKGNCSANPIRNTPQLLTCAQLFSETQKK
jgi:hypothetical protein